MPDLKLRQRRLDRTAVNPLAGFGFIRLIQLGQVLGNAFIQLLLLVFEPLQARMAPRGRNSLELAAINRHQITRDQTCRSAKLDEGPARRDKSGFVVFTEIGDGLEIGPESIDQPHHFDIALALGFEAP
ncbi:hypothetical protein D3C87_1404930 [compost metagenome]